MALVFCKVHLEKSREQSVQECDTTEAEKQPGVEYKRITVDDYRLKMRINFQNKY
jgi:hypothetical protein